MSDEKEKKDKDKERESKPTGQPDPKSPALFEWLEKLFDLDRSPEKLVIRIVTGPTGNTDGPIIKSIWYQPAEYAPTVKSPPSKQRPTREKLVGLANEIWSMCQERCDNLRRSILCGVFACHYATDIDYYESKVIRYYPRDGKRGVPDGAPVDEDEPKTIAERSAEQALEHNRRLVDMYLGANEALNERMVTLLEFTAKENIDLRQRLSQTYDMLERARSLEDERKARAEWRAVGVKAADKAVTMAVDVAPSFLAYLTGKPPVGIQKTPESIAIANFFKLESEGGLLTVAQAQAAFGVWDDKDPEKLVRPGVLTPDQARLLYRVGQCEVSADELDRVTPGSGDPLEVTQAQLDGLQHRCGFDVMSQLMPIVAIFQARIARRGASAQTQAQAK